MSNERGLLSRLQACVQTMREISPEFTPHLEALTKEYEASLPPEEGSLLDRLVKQYPNLKFNMDAMGEIRQKEAEFLQEAYSRFDRLIELNGGKLYKMNRDDFAFGYLEALMQKYFERKET